MREVVVFMLFYMLTFAVGAGIVILLGADFMTGISGTARTDRQCRPRIRPGRPDGTFRAICIPSAR